MQQEPFRYPLPTASAFVDFQQYIPLLLSAVDESLNNEYVWPEGQGEQGRAYAEDLLAWIAEVLPDMTTFTLPVGTIMQYGSSTPPSGWLRCDGSAVSRTAYPKLFAVLGTQYGAGDGSSSFNLPDLRGRVAMGSSDTHPLASSGGSESHVLTMAEMPAHAHQVGAIWYQPGAGNQRVGTGALDYLWHSPTTTAVGGNAAHNNMQPYLTVAFIIYAG